MENEKIEQFFRLFLFSSIVMSRTLPNRTKMNLSGFKDEKRTIFLCILEVESIMALDSSAI